MHELEAGMDRLANYFSGSTQRSVAVTSQPKNARTPNVGGITRKVAAWGLGKLASSYVKRHHPIVIGITGIKGKTVFKRTLTELLAPAYDVSASVLSYNTEIGLPFSIFGITAPRTRVQRVRAIASILSDFVRDSAPPQVLILEYGVNSQADAKTLLKIARPTWLIVTDLSMQDPNFDRSGREAGVKYLIDNLGVSKVLWNANDPLLKSISPPLDPSLGFRRDELIERGAVEFNGEVVAVNREMVGTSAELSVCAALMVATKLGISSSDLKRFLTAAELPSN